MAWLITSINGQGASGTAANTDPSVNQAPIIWNPEPLFTQRQLLTTVFVWAGTWGGASAQIFICPQTAMEARSFNPVWFPIEAPITAAGPPISFAHRWGGLKLEISGATLDTAGLYAGLFGYSSNL